MPDADCKGLPELVTARRSILKRATDITISSVLLIVLSPIMALTIIAIALSMGLPVMFVQERPGLDEGLFGLLKFRTMTDTHDREGRMLQDAARLTPVGRAIRGASLDELPQLVNVLKGQMSLVGPRPLLQEYLPLYSGEQRRRHSVRPGLTGLAQVRGRNAQTWPRRLSLDVWYVDHWTFTLDLVIMSWTVLQVLRGRGISNRGHATMPPFEG